MYHGSHGNPMLKTFNSVGIGRDASKRGEMDDASQRWTGKYCTCKDSQIYGLNSCHELSEYESFLKEDRVGYSQMRSDTVGFGWLAGNEGCKYFNDCCLDYHSYCVADGRDGSIGSGSGSSGASWLTSCPTPAKSWPV